MTDMEFQALLVETKTQFTWQVLPDDQIVATLNRDGWESFQFDPITAVAFLATGKVFRGTQYRLAAETMELDSEYADRIVLASTRCNEYYRDLRGRIGELLDLRVKKRKKR